MNKTSASGTSMHAASLAQMVLLMVTNIGQCFHCFHPLLSINMECLGFCHSGGWFLRE
uniref:Uncharacterized protein n=1 Tax=Parascaris univalens TaxID=6257 RepID=A0A915BAS7_PARUN